MTNTPRPDGADPTHPVGPSHPVYSIPRMRARLPYGPTYQAPQVPDPTQQLRAVLPLRLRPVPGQYRANTADSTRRVQRRGDRRLAQSPRWLWVVAAVAVLLVVGLGDRIGGRQQLEQDTVVAPPPMPEPTTTTTRTPTTTPSLRPLPPIVPVPTTTPPSESATPGATETVVYEVNGNGRAINITYVDTGSVLQTEFNVVLPWRKEVELPSPATDSASLTIINVGREVTCSVTINGRPGRGATPATG